MTCEKLSNRKKLFKSASAADGYTLRGSIVAPNMLDDDVVLRHTLPVFTGLGRCPIVSWDFAGAVSIFGPDALPVVHQ